MNYDNVTMKEYMEKKLEMWNNLGRKQNATYSCEGVDCVECPFYKKYNGHNCHSLELMYPEKAIEIVMNYASKVDWSEVPVDTKVLVKYHIDDEWVKRHFAKYEDDKIYTYSNGTSSFTYDSHNNNLVSWK